MLSSFTGDSFRCMCLIIIEFIQGICERNLLNMHAKDLMRQILQFISKPSKNAILVLLKSYNTK